MRKWVLCLVLSFVTLGILGLFTPAAAQISSTSNSQTRISTGSTGVVLMAAQFAPKQGERTHDGRNRNGRGGEDRKKDGSFHGAEMSTTSALLAVVLAMFSYFVFVRHKSEKRA